MYPFVSYQHFIVSQMTTGSFTTAVAYPGNATLDWNTEDSLDSVTKGDTLKIATSKAARVIIGDTAIPGAEIQMGGMLTSGKLIGSFNSVYTAGISTGITAQQSTDGTITGFGTAFSSSMENGGIILWEDGGTTPIGEFLTPTSMSAVTFQSVWPEHKKQPFKVYYDGVYMDGASGVLGASFIAGLEGKYLPAVVNEDNAPVQLIILDPIDQAFIIYSAQHETMFSVNTTNNSIQIYSSLVQNSSQSYLPNLITVVDPSNEHAEAAGVPNMGLYRGNVDPHIIYQRVDS